MDFLPIENYGVIGNMSTMALVSVIGSIDFLCYPEFDSPSIFAALLDPEKAGFFCIRPELHDLRTKQLYLPDTNILLTRFLAEDGVAELTDFMPVLQEGLPDRVVRMLRVIKGRIAFEMICRPRFNYARNNHSLEMRDGMALFRPESCKCPTMALQATVALESDKNDVIARFTLNAGETATFVFGQARERETDLFNPSQIEEEFNQTSDYWRHWIAHSQYSGRWRETVNRSALVLKLLSSHKYGSLVAAATFGLPEFPGGERNWDYRYTWLRDSAFSLYALMRLGFTPEAREFMQWLKDRITQDAEHGPLQVLYAINGDQKVDEVTLDHLRGYRDSRPVRIGNAAYRQLQLDVYGELFDAVYLSNKYGDAISYQGWNSLKDILAWLSKNWERPDEGIWEVRGERREFLHSRLMCWVAFDRAIRLGDKRSLPGPYPEWSVTRDAIAEDIHKNFWNEKRQAFVQYKGADSLDAAVLLMPLIRFVSPMDPRWLSTLEAIEKELTEDSLVYRYRVDPELEGFGGGTEGSFTACSFWFIECLARSHKLDKARLLFEKMLGYSNHLGLYSEQLGRSGQHLGNFPQALTHLALISAASYLDRELSGKGPVTWR